MIDAKWNVICPDCDHGVRGGKPCESCSAAGIVQVTFVSEVVFKYDLTIVIQKLIKHALDYCQAIYGDYSPGVRHGIEILLPLIEDHSSFQDQLQELDQKLIQLCGSVL